MIIAVCNQKGGVSKTTSTINLGACLAELGKRVLVVDCDPQYNLTTGLSIDTKNNKTIHELLLDDDTTASEVIVKTEFQMDIIPANLNLANAEVEISSMIGREQLLQEKLEQIYDNYDYIIVDCNPALGLLTLNALVACDRILIPLDAGAFALEGIGNLQNLIVKIKRKLNPKIELLGVLLARANKNTKINKLFEKELREAFDDKLFKTIIHNNIKIVDSQMDGKPLNYYDRNSTGYKEYLELAKEVLRNEQ